MGKRVTLRRLLNILGDFLFPPACLVCEKLLETPGIVCPSCMEAYQEEKKRQCGMCFKPMYACDCSLKGCRHKGMTHLYKVLPYRPSNKNSIGNQLIYAIKDKHLYYASEFMANELYETLKYHMLNLSGYEITYIPASSKRMAEIGYNQMKLIAEILAQRLGIPVSAVLCRTREALPQKELREKERVENTKNLFAVKKRADVKGKRYLLIDDIATTGSTLLAAGKTLRDAGASKILYLSIAATVKS